MKEPLVSVIAPAYMHSKYIQDCLWSVALQNYQNKELIVIDDASKDNTPDLIISLLNNPEFSKHFIRADFVAHKINVGAHQRINEGIANSQGDYISIINTDDMFETNRFSSIISEMKKNDAQIAFSLVDTIDDSGERLHNEEWKYYNDLQKSIERHPLTHFAFFENNVAISTGNLTFTKKLHFKVGDFKNYKYIHDWDFILRAILESEPMFIKETVYLYRLHPTNSFKNLALNKELCYNETVSVLGNFFARLQRNQYANSSIISSNAYEYFILHVLQNPDLGHIWNSSKYFKNVY